MERFVFTHSTPAPRVPAAPAHVAAYGPASGLVSYPAGRVYPPVPVELAATTARIRTRGRTPHGLHATLTIVSCGLWAPMWIGHAIWNHATVKRTTIRTGR